MMFQGAEKIIAIRREDQSIWERRAPFSPNHVKKFVSNGVKVIVQPSNRRAYPVQSYIDAGAISNEDISEASVIFGVKQVPIDQLIPDKTYCFFSHTIKGQENNMSMLDTILDKRIRLIDYEKLTDEAGQRIVAFGRMAGMAGIINILHGLGLRLLALGHHTPFMHIGLPHNYRDSSMARQAVREAGYEIARGHMPKSIEPLTFVFTGSGNVSQGAQEIFQELPYEFVAPEMLHRIAEEGDTNKVYGCRIGRSDYLERIEGGRFDPAECQQHPERYRSTFSEKFAPHASVIINGIYWSNDCPRLITIPDAKNLLKPIDAPWLRETAGAPVLPQRMLAICDISADPDGSIEFMNECTTIDTPFCLYDAYRHKDTKSFSGPGVLICSIDNMPTQLPRESTDFFGDLLYPVALNILESNAHVPLEDNNFNQAVERAIIASNGKLTPKYEYIQDLRQSAKRSLHKSGSNGMTSKKRNVLIVGAGHVASPLIEYLYRDPSIDITVACDKPELGDNLIRSYPGVKSAYLDITETCGHLQELISKADVIVSILPATVHHIIAEACIQEKTHMVNAGYINEELMALHDDAIKADVTILNEVGLDPGIDHLLALECIQNVKMQGGKVTSFESYCGGLPVPEFSDNPLRYKFSWSPQEVLLNIVSAAKYKQKGQIVEIKEGGELMEATKQLIFLPGFNLEGYPSRDSTIYAKYYDIEDAETILRGTIRYSGFAQAVRCLQMIGLLDAEPHSYLFNQGPNVTWRQLVCKILGLESNMVSYSDLRKSISERTGSQIAVDLLEDLDLLDNYEITKCDSPLDTLTHELERKLALKNGERDLIILRHEIGVQWPDSRKEIRGVNFVVYGDANGHSAMAKTVGLPAAIATEMILNGEIQERGAILPFAQEIYRPLLLRLRAEGLSSTENSKFVK